MLSEIIIDQAIPPATELFHFYEKMVCYFRSKANVYLFLFTRRSLIYIKRQYKSNSLIPLDGAPSAHRYFRHMTKTCHSCKHIYAQCCLKPLSNRLKSICKHWNSLIVWTGLFDFCYARSWSLAFALKQNSPCPTVLANSAHTVLGPDRYRLQSAWRESAFPFLSPLV